MEASAADWMLPISTPPVRDGAIVIDRGRILFVGPALEARARPEYGEAKWVNFGRAAILPGFVNTHTHLELTAMRGLLEGLPFQEWIATVTRTRRDRLTDESLQTSALLGVAEAIRAGITTIGDTGDSGAPFDAMIAAGIRGIAYREVFGPDPAVVEKSLEGIQARVEDMRSRETSQVRAGISPHAPYTVSAALYKAAIEYAGREGLDLCTHTAESAAEQELMLSGEGDFARSLRGRGIAWGPPGVSTIKYFEDLGVLAARPLVIHCVTVNEEDIRLIAARGARVAHCPKSNAKLGHGVAPLPAMLKAGVIVGLGTDSVASNNRCDIIDEARTCGLIHRGVGRSYSAPSAETLLQLATMGGAQALGLEAEVGSLEPGKQADIIAIDLSGAHNTPVNDPVAAIIFSASAGDVIFAAVAGRPLMSDRVILTLNEAELKTRASPLREPI
jgi:5-methylthioadenosine/S-adenosylhomocysteine deaminase